MKLSSLFAYNPRVFAGNPFSSQHLTHPNDSSSHQLLDLLPNHGVLHVLVQRLRVLLGLLENALHHWVRNDANNLRIPLDPCHRLLLGLALPGRVHLLQTLPALLFNLPSVLALLVCLCSLVARIQTLAVLPHGEIQLGLPNIGPHKRRVLLDRLVTVLHSLRQRHEFLQSSSAIGVSTWVLRGTLDGFGIGLDCARKVGGFKELVALLTRFLGFNWVNIRRFLALDFGLFSGAELGENIGCAVFGEGALVVKDCIVKIALLRVCSANATKGPEILLVWQCLEDGDVLVAYFAISLKSARMPRPSPIAVSHSLMQPSKSPASNFAAAALLR